MWVLCFFYSVLIEKYRTDKNSPCTSMLPMSHTVSSIKFWLFIILGNNIEIEHLRLIITVIEIW